jgi:hypothetical protein
MKMSLTKIKTIESIMVLILITILMINQLTPMLVLLGIGVFVQIWACFYVEDYYNQRIRSRWKERLLALLMCLALGAYFYFTKHTII